MLIFKFKIMSSSVSTSVWDFLRCSHNHYFWLQSGSYFVSIIPPCYKPMSRGKDTLSYVNVQQRSFTSYIEYI